MVSYAMLFVFTDKDSAFAGNAEWIFFLKQMDNLTEMEVGVRPFFRPLPGSPKNV